MVGEIRCSGATSGGVGKILVSFAPAEIPIFGVDLMVAVDPTNLSLITSLGVSSLGEFVIPDISRRIPALAGFSTYVQIFETAPIVRASQGLRFTVIP